MFPAPAARMVSGARGADVLAPSEPRMFPCARGAATFAGSVQHRARPEALDTGGDPAGVPSVRHAALAHVRGPRDVAAVRGLRGSGAPRRHGAVLSAARA